ncbi:DUF523 domain-containing protein [Clostridium sp.]|uniref:DUF523 domain-containing protein n=1 Tax=Clostridium sp. TaxID=1506 RepID=UPI002630F231|nr:DUF523 domain-containing protein [Clostridium sp.]
MYLISSCLCGINCKYSGGNNLNKECLHLLKEGKAILICPEQLGGLSTPRLPSEIVGKAEDILKGIDKIINKNNINVTKEFLKGAEETLKIAKLHNINKAILKEGSPSCGVNYVYDGSFTGNKIRGRGLTTELLIKNGIKVISDMNFTKESKNGDI